MNKKKLIQSYYEKHHRTGNRLRQCVLEKERGELFSKWIGKNIKVLDLGGRDGTFNKTFLANKIK